MTSSHTHTLSHSLTLTLSHSHTLALSHTLSRLADAVVSSRLALGKSLSAKPSGELPKTPAAAAKSVPSPIYI